MLFFGIVSLSVTATVGMFDVSSAQQVQLEQQINPIECTYTTTQTGTGSNIDSTCDNQPIPLVTSIIANNGRPVIKGVFSATRAIMLRVWINGQWYTYGTDARLTVNGDLWELDLSSLNVPLIAGVYTVVIEVETNDGLLLRNTEAAIFEILNVQTPATQQLSPPISSVNAATPFFTRMILPQTQEAARDIISPSGQSAVENTQPESHDDTKNTPTVTNKFQMSLTVIIVLIFVIAMLFYLFRYRL
jgi:hypothetical protein